MTKTKFYLFWAVMTAITQTAFARDVQQNFDFSKSGCAKMPKYFSKAVAVRVFVRMAEGGLSIHDGATGWEKRFQHLNTFTAIDYMLAGISDAWAVYATLESDGGKIEGFTVQYMFGAKEAPGLPECVYTPRVPERVKILDMPPAAIHAYSSGLGLGVSDTIEPMRKKLEAFIETNK